MARSLRLWRRLRTPWPHLSVGTLGDLRATARTVDFSPGDPLPAPDAFMRLHPAAQAGRPPALFIDDPRVNPKSYATGHPSFTGLAPDIGVFRLKDSIYDGRGLIHATDGTILAGLETTPAYWRLALEASGTELLGADTSLRRFGRPAIACITPGFQAYGHWLLEILPRLWLARRVLGDAFERYLVLIDEDVPAWSYGLMRAAAGVEARQIKRFRRVGTLLKVAELIVPGMLHGDFCFHPAASEFYDTLPDSGRQDLPEIFYIPRPAGIGQTSGGDARVCINADEIAAWMAARGIPAVLPERLPWADQIALFRRARIVIGEYGSGLHNAIFSPPSTKVICLGLISDVQSKIAGFRQHGIAFVGPSSQHDEGGRRYSTFPLEGIELAFEAALRP